MSIPSKPPLGVSSIHGYTKLESSHNRPISIWQLPKLKTSSQSITPASTPSRTSFSTSSSPPMNAQQSYTTSPDGPLGFELSDLERIPPLNLPTSPPSSQPTSPPIEPSLCSRPPGLMRRFSRGASNRLRGRSSMTNMRINRDQNAGSVIRRRSDSRSVIDGSYDVSDVDLEDMVEEETVEGSRPVIPDAGCVTHRSFPRTLSRRSSENRVLVTPLKATVFTKITRKKKKNLRFFLDEDAAKVCWTAIASNVRKQIYIDDMREIRAGDKARNHLAEYQITDDCLNRWITIVYFDPERRKGRSIKFMHLIAPDPMICDQWLRALQHMMRTRDSLMAGMVANKEKHWIGHWHREMIKRFGTNPHTEEDEKMDFASMRRTCRNFSIYKSDRALRSLFEAVTRNRSDTLNQQQYLKFFRLLTERHDIRRVFDEAKSIANPNMSFTEFGNFLRSSQGVDVDADPAQWLAVFNKFALKKRGQASDLQPEDDDLSTVMSFEAFQEFVSSSFNSALKPMPPNPCLDRPLNEYFISSSHNTYLEGRQLRGESSAEMYVQALKKGCRCIEIDCENGVDGKPCVTHVRTATSRIPFVDCIKAINQYAFYASDYPLIVSLEVHCNADQQKLMARIMKDVFGDQLLLHTLVEGSYTLPSPEDLKRRILVKVKVPREEDSFSPLVSLSPLPMSPTEPIFGHRRQRSSSAPNPRLIQQSLARLNEAKPWTAPIPLSPALRSLTIITPLTTTSAYSGSANTSARASSSDDSEVEFRQTSSFRKNKVKSNIVKELGELGVYTRGVKFNDWKSVESRSPNHVYSFNENTFEQKCKTHEGKVLLENHNTQCLMRIYPRPTRFYSSNFDPLQFWRRGVQMVATNWQTYDLGTQINDAMFGAGTDRTGYVLKPEELRQSRSNGSDRRQEVEKRWVAFSVDIISAQHLEAPADLRMDGDMHPYVEFEMYCAEDRGKDVAIGEGGTDASARNGKSGLGSPIRKRTPIIEGNGFDPVFDGAEKETINVRLKTKFPSLVFVRWTVWNSADGRNYGTTKEPLSSFTAKISSLEEGYRQLPLYNKHGELLHSKLFCRIRKECSKEVEADSPLEETVVEHRRISDENGRSGKDFLRRVFSRTPSERRRISRDNENGRLSRTASMERYIS